MDAIQQHLLDTWRAARHGAPVPPPPGRDDVRTLRSLRDHRRFTRVLTGRPLHPFRTGFRRLLRRRATQVPRCS
ncbi:hypothetical protein ACFU5O_21775 [Streptomyces sp. NPDC057445]|uniref:hypothetical protein n=1 Tax=Streptomyces sp. NPDC057445 TaxID=3346136 RepID=UPI00369DE7FE